MLRISKLTDYATVILSYLALEPARMVSATQIAKAIHLRTPTVSKILKILAEAHLVTGFRGTEGGYQLARAAQEVTLADVVTAVEGNLAMTECCMSENLCSLDSFCTLKTNWKTINKIMLSALAGYTLKDMMHPMTENSLSLKGIPIRVKG
jgi:FeS assembly SUF system regulator